MANLLVISLQPFVVYFISIIAKYVLIRIQITLHHANLFSMRESDILRSQCNPFRFAQKKIFHLVIISFRVSSRKITILNEFSFPTMYYETEI